MEKEKVLELLLDSHYYTRDDLRFNNEVGLFFSKDQLDEFMRTKNDIVAHDNHDMIYRLPLKTFNSPYCYYVMGDYLSSCINDYLTIIADDMNEHNSLLFARNMSHIMESRIFSEIENTLKIENVPTTRKRIQDIYENKSAPKDKNDIIIRNMIDAIRYLSTELPAFNKENLYKLYNILSHDCLDDDNKLPENGLYRDDAVYVDVFEGAKADSIDDMMNSLFDFVNNVKHDNIEKLLLPHICHYYIVYVHPYFDYNGRTARMVSLWISLLLNISCSPFFISEAINENKAEYYRALTNTRIMGNDLTYFIGYILETATRFSLIYEDVENIEERLNQSGCFLTKNEKLYLKKILIHYPNGYLNQKMFVDILDNNITKQAALKILNGLVEYNILQKSFNKKNEAIYRVNQKYIKYKID